MKIKADFVTNSSTTSFILIVDDIFDKHDFLNAAGVKSDSEISFLFEQLFSCLEKEMVPIEQYQLKDREREIGDFPDDLKRRIAEAEENGKKVYMGNLSSDSEQIESFFCVDSFIIEGDTIYLDAVECAW